MNIEYIDYNNYNKKDIIIKDILKRRLNLNEDIKIETLEDIARLSELFSKTIPFSNFTLVDGDYSIDIDAIVECIERRGGRCLIFSIIWGLLFTELGIEAQLIKAIEDTPHKLYDIFKYHYATAFKWSDGKYYFMDQGLGYFNQYYPIEIGNPIPIKGYSRLLPDCLYKVIQNNDVDGDSRFILQKQLINKDIEFKSVFEFQLNQAITVKNIIDRSNDFNNSSYSIPIASILRDDGYYFYANDSITIYLPNSNKDIIKITDSNQLELLLFKYFKIKINQFKCFTNSSKLNLQKDANNIIYIHK